MHDRNALCLDRFADLLLGRGRSNRGVRSNAAARMVMRRCFVMRSLKRHEENERVKSGRSSGSPIAARSQQLNPGFCCNQVASGFRPFAIAAL